MPPQCPPRHLLLSPVPLPLTIALKKWCYHVGMQFLLLRVLWKLSGHQLVIPTHKHMLQISKHCAIKETALDCSHMVLQFTSKKKSTVFSLLVLNIITTLCFLLFLLEKTCFHSYVILWPVYKSLIQDENPKPWTSLCLNKKAPCTTEYDINTNLISGWQ